MFISNAFRGSSKVVSRGILSGGGASPSCGGTTTTLRSCGGVTTAGVVYRSVVNSTRTSIIMKGGGGGGAPTAATRRLPTTSSINNNTIRMPFSSSSSSAGSGSGGWITGTSVAVALVATGYAVMQQDPTYRSYRTSKKQAEISDAAIREMKDKFASYWPRYVLILFGPPGAGKGTHGPKIESLLDVPQLSTGDMLRAAVAAQTDVGKKAQAIMKAGGLVSDDIVVGIIKDRIKADDCKFGFILDGFPRTLQQAKSLDKMLAEEGAFVTKVVELHVPDSVLEERICGRWIHKSSGRSYHVKYAPPKAMKLDEKNGTPIPETMLDDETGEALMQRKDDTPTALIKRLQGYHKETVPILDHYKPNGIVKTVNANQNMDGVWKEILQALQRS